MDTKLKINNKEKQKRTQGLSIWSKVLLRITFLTAYLFILVYLLSVMYKDINIYSNVEFFHFNINLIEIIFLALLSLPVIILISLRGFTKQLIEIEKATGQIIKGDFSPNLKEKNSKILNTISHNLNNVNKSFKEAVESEIRSERMKSELITNVSHDLKTPLTSIINYVDLLKNKNISEEEKQEYLNILVSKSNRLKVLVEDLFEATQANTGDINLNIERVNISELLKEALKELEEKIEESTLKFSVNIVQEDIYLMLDNGRTLRVFENLINNALKYSANNSRIYIELKEEKENVIFEIKNIASYELNCDPNEFRERFKRGDIARNTEGSGLGLSIATSLVEIQGGELNISIDGDLFKVTMIFKSIK